MARTCAPEVGGWYVAADGRTFEVVASDPDEGTIEIQYFDGAIEELDEDAWPSVAEAPAAPPEDWSGSLDVGAEDLDGGLPRLAGGLGDPFWDL